MFLETPPKKKALAPGGPTAGTLRFLGFDQAANTGGISWAADGTPRIAVMGGLQNSDALPTTSEVSWTPVNAGLQADGLGARVWYQIGSNLTIGSWSATRLFLWEFDVTSGTPTWEIDTVYDSEPSGDDLVPWAGFGGLPSGAWALGAALWTFGSVDASSGMHSALTFRTGSSGPPGRTFGDAGPLASIAAENKQASALVGAVITALTRISATVT